MLNEESVNRSTVHHYKDARSVPCRGPICVTKPNFNKIVQWKNENFGGSLFSLITDVLLLTIVLGVFLDIFEPGALLAPLGKIFIR